MIMKKRTNKKLALNKQRISELSGGNLGEVKGGCTTRPCETRYEKCLISRERTCLCPVDTRDFKGCGIVSVVICKA